MIRRLAVAIALVVGGMSFAPAPADAHPAERFTACTARSTTTTQCDRRGAAFIAGQTVYLRGRVTPAHPGFGEVWRRAPHSQWWAKVGLIGINEQGRIRWSWVTDRYHVASAPYTFQFRIPGHGRSWATQAWVLSGE